MPTPSQDIRFLEQLLQIFEKIEEPNTAILEEAHAFVIRRNVATEANWKITDVDKAIGLISEIVPRYVNFFFDPRLFPVTHAQKQKSLAITLDKFFSNILWQKVRINEVPELVQPGEVVKDPFLDEPILFMKQEARGKNFPKNKRGELTHPEALIERFQEKLLAKGIQGSRAAKQVRFEYGP